MRWRTHLRCVEKPQTATRGLDGCSRIIDRMIWRRINRSRKWMDGMSDLTKSCRLHFNVPEQAETPRRVTTFGIQISVTASRRSISSRISPQPAGPLLFPKNRNPIERHEGNKVDVRAASAGHSRKSSESSLSCARVHYQWALPVCFALHSTRPGGISQPREPKFRSMNYNALNETLRGSIVTIWNRVDSRKRSACFFWIQ
jgi:hypothetical protein